MIDHFTWTKQKEYQIQRVVVSGGDSLIATTTVFLTTNTAIVTGLSDGYVREAAPGDLFSFGEYR